MSVQPGPRVAVKMEVAPFYGEDGLELLPDFVQLPPGFNGEAVAAEEEESGAQPQRKLLLVGAQKKAPPPPRTSTQPADLGGASSSAEAAGRFPVLPGPEGSLLKLPGAAPDLEQLLLPGSPGGGGSPASAFLFRPPPPSAPPPHPPPPPAVTQEQEGFADGFVKALADLHKQNQLLGVSPAPLSPSLCPPPPPRQEAVYTTLGGFDPGSPPPPPPPSGTSAAASSAAFFSRRALEEPQTVPEASPGVPPPPPPLPLSSGDSPPPPSLSPLDAESQERLKAERKRLRNRIAASKCRRRKLERIARLEEKVKALKGQNAELAATASLLRAQVAQLQGRVRSHLSSGCPINASAAAPEARPEAEAC